MTFFIHNFFKKVEGFWGNSDFFLTWVLVITAEAAKHLNTQGRENKEQKEEEKALEVYCLILCYTPP